ncbi:MAG: hypothetical protein KKB30_16140 [Proteobacteria bacterium]|nr:hypothetical protein [Pseudomonadota bacterium]MBU1714137.1 hypothetical protein [Pseudomonadota bacterium]
MKKIFFIITFLCFAFPFGAKAEVVGALMPTKNVPYFMTVHEAMIQELAALGAAAEVILQKPAPSEMAWKNATRKLVTLGAEVIVAYGSDTALAIISENSNVPVVYTGAYAPVECGIAGKVTGMGATVPLNGLIDNLKEISKFKSLGIMYSSLEIGSVKQMEAAEGLALKIGAKVKRINTFGVDSFDLSGIDALLLTSASDINQEENLLAIMEQARAKKLATASVLCGACQNGVLMSLSANPEHQGKGAARMVAQILKGKNASDIPMDNKPEAEMTINLKEAKDLGFSVPFELLGTAKVVK